MVKFATALFFSLTTALVIFGCGGNSDDEGQPEARATAAETNGGDVEPGGGSPSGSGNGTLAVDGQVFEFAVIFCGFTPEETRNENVPFSFRGTGENAEGRTFSVDASIVEVSVAGLPARETHSISMWYDDTPTDVIYETSASPLAEAAEFAIDGKEISYEGEFVHTDASVGTGILEAICP